MDFITIPTEQTTAVTDLLLSLAAFLAVIYIHTHRQRDTYKANTWILILSLLGAAALTGAFIHGFVWGAETKNWLNHGLSLFLGLLVAVFVVAVVYDLFGLDKAKRVLPIMLCVAVGFFLLRLFWSGSFLVFIIYQFIAMLFAFAGYCWLLLRGQPGTKLIALGVLTSLFAAAVQALQLFSFSLVWQFDHNGTYHLIQLAAVVMFAVGLQKSLTHSVETQPN